MVVNAQAEQATSRSGTITGFLSTSRNYLGLQPIPAYLYSGILRSEFVDPPRYRIANLQVRRVAA